MNRIIYSLLLGMVGFFSVSANATCNTNESGATQLVFTMGLSPVIVQRDTPVGSIIAEVHYPDTSEKFLSCSDNSSAYYSTSMFSSRSAISDVYNTNVPGVGVKLAFQGTSWAFSNPAYQRTYARSGIGTVGLTITLVKTDNIVSGVVNSGMLGYVWGDGDPSLKALTVNLLGNQVTQVACSITTPNLSFPIGNVPATNFGTTQGIIPSGGQVTQNLGLSCDNYANINVSLSGTQNPDVANNSVLALTGQGSAGVASGVGVQILYNGSPLQINNRLVLKQSSGGQEIFPLTARYYQTRTSVSTGTANTSATLNLTYQ